MWKIGLGDCRKVRCLWVLCVFPVLLASACSPRGGSTPTPTPTPSSAPPVPNDLVTQTVAPLAGKPAEHTAVKIFGRGFQSGAIVIFDGIATPATVLNDGVINTTAPPHSAGAIDIVVADPDGRTSRLEKAFTYVEDLHPPGDITIGPGDSVPALLGFDQTCGDDVPCRRVSVQAPADDVVVVELVSLDGREHIGLYERVTFQGPTVFPKQLTVKGGQQVWVIGESALFRLTARLQNDDHQPGR